MGLTISPVYSIPFEWMRRIDIWFDFSFSLNPRLALPFFCLYFFSALFLKEYYVFEFYLTARKIWKPFKIKLIPSTAARNLNPTFSASSLAVQWKIWRKIKRQESQLVKYFKILRKKKNRCTSSVKSDRFVSASDGLKWRTGHTHRLPWKIDRAPVSPSFYLIAFNC